MLWISTNHGLVNLTHVRRIDRAPNGDWRLFVTDANPYVADGRLDLPGELASVTVGVKHG